MAGGKRAPVAKESVQSVCQNTMCRKRWKPLSELALPVFCPSCRVQVESVCDTQDLYTLWARVTEVWSTVKAEIHAATGLPGPLPVHGAPSRAVFDAMFPLPQGPVATWNGMKKMRSICRTRVVAKGTYLLTLQPLAVLDPDTLDVMPGAQLPHANGMPVPLFVLDMAAEHPVGEELTVIAMPNPSKAERTRLPFITKVITEEAPAAPPVPPAPTVLVPSTPDPMWATVASQMCPYGIHYEMPAPVMEEPVATFVSDHDSDIPCTPSPHFSSAVPDHLLKPLTRLAEKTDDVAGCDGSTSTEGSFNNLLDWSAERNPHLPEWIPGLSAALRGTRPTGAGSPTGLRWLAADVTGQPRVSL